MPDNPSKFLNEEEMQRYSVENAQKHYANTVYYKQRRGGDSWFHGRVSNRFREGHEATFGETDIFRNLKGGKE